MMQKFNVRRTSRRQTYAPTVTHLAAMSARPNLVLGETKIATPPCFPRAGDQKLLPDHLDHKDSITSERDTRVSCKKTKSDLELLA